ncbi:hypothetical protein M3P21_21275 [Ruegeria sp. 2012CJ41-6]|uniref:Uncharacterized protein n=1 Tax=Ruegeria spongiae TaxID=2942209 RepID=A0ABT0Q853_9RHOB|nr:hypothetical protein [Ruegeria spongiae]MCL6286051.1 hypothetical protein [Ruegeria spongiae]
MTKSKEIHELENRVRTIFLDKLPEARKKFNSEVIELMENEMRDFLEEKDFKKRARMTAGILRIMVDCFGGADFVKSEYGDTIFDLVALYSKPTTNL